MREPIRRRTCLVLLALLVCALLGCFPAVAPSGENYVLVHEEDGRLVAYGSASPIYEQFERQVLVDDYLALLISTFENTTTAYLATNTPRQGRQRTIANHLIIVLEQMRNGVLHDVSFYVDERRVSVELALGLAVSAENDLAPARFALADGLGRVLLELAGTGPLPDSVDPPMSLDKPISEAQAFSTGFAAALAALHADALSRTQPALCLPADSPLAGAERVRATAGQTLLGAGTQQETMRTPILVGAFLYRLLSEGDGYYPQQYMLWFANYEPEEFAYAKFLLAVRRMPSAERPSVERFIISYGETFPAERERIERLAGEGFAPGG